MAIATSLGDVLIYSLSIANAITIDQTRCVKTKLRKDETRFPMERFRVGAFG